MRYLLGYVLLLLTTSVSTGVLKAEFVTFQNNTPIVLVDNAVANPYPSSINVAGINGVLTDMTVSLFGLSHTFPNDLAAVVVAPNLSSVILFSGPGDGTDAVNLTFNFNDNAATQLPDNGVLTSGTFKPGQEQFDEFFPAPGPLGKVLNTDAAPWFFSFQPLLSQNPNGQWNLYVLDGQALDVGTISGGWSITFNAVPEPSGFVLSTLIALALTRLRTRKTS